MPGEAACVLARRQRLGRLCVVAGFQVSIDGRFWVSTEGIKMQRRTLVVTATFPIPSVRLQ
jgi:hypothetical protein